MLPVIVSQRKQGKRIKAAVHSVATFSLLTQFNEGEATLSSVLNIAYIHTCPGGFRK